MCSTLASMTGFSRVEGNTSDLAWFWELRSVNSKGLDLRFRLPAGWESLEPRLRKEAGRTLRRGALTATLSVKKTEQPCLMIDSAALEQALAFAMDLHKRIPGSPVPRAEALLALPGVLKPVQAYETVDTDAVAAGFSQALAALMVARRAEGARLSQIFTGLLAEIEALQRQAATQAADQPAAHRARVMENLAALLREAPSLPEERVTQEVALLAARSNVREELDRLASHIEAAQSLLREAVNIGRRFDFLVQEFNREANTLCSKSTSVALTTTGLKLKAAIEQMREQVQNIE